MRVRSAHIIRANRLHAHDFAIGRFGFDPFDKGADIGREVAAFRVDDPIAKIDGR